MIRIERLSHNLMHFSPAYVCFVGMSCALGTYNRRVKMIIELPNEPIELIPLN
jgi:hypothetical protein